MNLTDQGREDFSREELFPKSHLERQLQWLIEAWNLLDLEEDFGAADRGVITSLREQVTEALAESPPNIALVESITARVFLLIQSNSDY
ncbi:hypothetical protein [Singulisphaera sp. PoT]|uniref:hypothetical protein n=1 Tax=Singulisphaera sp. PoT TaxID=3411797 RepID=UPI003BF58E8C